MTDIEDIIPVPRNLTDDLTKLEIAVHDLLKTNINSEKEFEQYIRTEQKKIHIGLSSSKLLYVYRTMIRDKKIEKHKHYEQFP